MDGDVIDNYNGKTRSISTFSGGEAFLCALALSLSTSEIIQQTKGGIQLDCMFIDEGFGSWDADSLTKAIEILTRLSYDRTIGIISHVDVLPKIIQKQICVTKSEDEGAKIKIII